MATALGKVQSRGQVTLPRTIRSAVDIRPGDTVVFTPTGPSTVELRILPRLTLADLLERYPIGGPIDEEADREAWQARAAKDIFGE